MKNVLISGLVIFILCATLKKLYCIFIYNKDIPINTSKNIYDNINKNGRWDMNQIIDDCEKSGSINTFTKNFAQTLTKKHCLNWVLKEPPEALSLLAIIAQVEEHDPCESSYEFWKFMQNPGIELLLTEAAYKGYIPAMSVLASFYENADRFEEAEYWRKFGTAYANPTSLLLRGMQSIIEGKLKGNDSLNNKGHLLIILAFILGENRVSDIPEFKNVKFSKEVSNFTRPDLLETICGIECVNSKHLVNFLEEITESMKGSVLISDLISIIEKMNTILDNPEVTVAEIQTIFPLRQILAQEINENLQNNDEALKAFNKAEFIWRHKRISAGAETITNVLFPIIFEN